MTERERERERREKWDRGKWIYWLLQQPGRVDCKVVISCQVARLPESRNFQVKSNLPHQVTRTKNMGRRGMFQQVKDLK